MKNKTKFRIIAVLIIGIFATMMCYQYYKLNFLYNVEIDKVINGKIINIDNRGESYDTSMTINGKFKYSNDLSFEGSISFNNNSENWSHLVKKYDVKFSFDKNHKAFSVMNLKSVQKPIISVGFQSSNFNELVLLLNDKNGKTTRYLYVAPYLNKEDALKIIKELTSETEYDFIK